MAVDAFEQVFYDLYLTNEDLKHDLYKSSIYAYLKSKANGDKDALAPWKDRPPPKVKPPPKAKSALRKRTRKTAADDAGDQTATKPSLNDIFEHLARLQSDGADLSCLASLVLEQPTPENLTD